MSSEVFLPGIAEFDEHPIPGAPAINDTYRESLSRLVLLQDRDVTHFYGCQLDLDEDKDVWMSPVEVDDGESFSYFQILYVNTTPQEAFNNPKLPVSLLEVDEASYKLTPAEHPGYEQLMSQFIGDRKHVLIRHCNTGMAYYPRSITPTQDRTKSSEHLEKIPDCTSQKLTSHLASRQKKKTPLSKPVCCKPCMLADILLQAAKYIRTA